MQTRHWLDEWSSWLTRDVLLNSNKQHKDANSFIWSIHNLWWHILFEIADIGPIFETDEITFLDFR